MSDATEARLRRCRVCNADAIFGPLYLYPETGMGKGEVLLATMGSARAFGKVHTVPLTAWACKECGQVELITADPEALFEHWSAEQS